MKKSIILAAIFICITLVSCTVDKSPGDLSETSVNSQVTQSIAASSEVTQPSDVVASSEVVSSNENEIKRDILDQGEHYTIYIIAIKIKRLTCRTVITKFLIMMVTISILEYTPVWVAWV